MDNRNLTIENTCMSDYIKGKNFDINNIIYVGKTYNKNVNIHYFNVRSQRTNKIYRCMFEISNTAELKTKKCTCPQFKETRSCKHLAACLYNYSDLIFEINDDKKIIQISEDIFNKFTKSKSLKPKQEVKLSLELYINNECNEFILEVIPKIGIDKTYVLKSTKLDSLINAIKNNDYVLFGKGLLKSI